MNQIRKFFSSKNIVYLFIILLLALTLWNTNSMWIHPDSMTSAGLRFIKTGPINFHYATYGPFAYLEAGALNALIFPLGIALGQWKTPAAFEEAYRLNHIQLFNTSFTHITIIINIGLIFLSLVLIYKVNMVDSNKYFGLLKLTLIFFAIPISFFQLSLDTVDVYVFFGVSFSIYVSFYELKRNEKPKLLNYLLVSFAFLFTIGIRINLGIFIIPVFFYISYQKFRNEKSYVELLLPIFAGALTAFSYLPLVSNPKTLKTSLEMLGSLSDLNLKSSILNRNFHILLINFGLIPFAIILVLCTTTYASRHLLNSQAKLNLLWVSLGACHLGLFLLNRNGFPKYLVPLVPLILLNSRLLNMNNIKPVMNLKESKYVKGISYSMIPIIFFIGVSNYNHYQSRSKFDSREVLIQILPIDKSWMVDASANVTVISELTRGENGLPYEDIKNRIRQFSYNNLTCDKVMFLSTRELNLVQQAKVLKFCDPKHEEYSVLEINPYRSSSRIRQADEWLGLLSLGTPADQSRLGFGPLFKIMVKKSWDYSNVFISKCSSIERCELVQRGVK